MAIAHAAGLRVQREQFAVGLLPVIWRQGMHAAPERVVRPARPLAPADDLHRIGLGGKVATPARGGSGEVQADAARHPPPALQRMRVFRRDTPAALGSDGRGEPGEDPGMVLGFGRTLATDRHIRPETVPEAGPTARDGERDHRPAAAQPGADACAASGCPGLEGVERHRCRRAAEGCDAATAHQKVGVLA